MANNCGSLLSAGLGRCNSRIQNISFAILLPTGSAYTNAELATVTKTKAYLAGDTAVEAFAAGIYLPLSGFEITTDEPDVVTSQLGTKSIFDDKVPSAMAYLDRSFHDYRHLWESNNSVVDIILGTKDGYFIMTSTANNSYRGLRAEIYSAPNLPKTDDPSKAHPIYFNFKSVTDFKALQIISMAFTQFDVEDIVPIGLDIRAIGTYGTGTITVLATLRGSDTGKAGLTDWNVVTSKAEDVAVTTFTDNGAGSYTLTVKKDAGGTPANLAAGDITKIFGGLVATNFYTYLTGVLEIKP